MSENGSWQDLPAVPFLDSTAGKNLRRLAALLMWAALMLPFVSAKGCSKNQWRNHTGMDIVLGAEGKITGEVFEEEPVSRSVNLVFALPFLVALWLGVKRAGSQPLDPLGSAFRAGMGWTLVMLALGGAAVGLLVGFLFDDMKPLTGLWVFTGGAVLFLLLYLGQTLVSTQPARTLFKEAQHNPVPKVSSKSLIPVCISGFLLMALLIGSILMGAHQAFQNGTSGMATYAFVFLGVLTPQVYTFIWMVMAARLRREWVSRAAWEYNAWVLIYLGVIAAQLGWFQ